MTPDELRALLPSIYPTVVDAVFVRDIIGHCNMFSHYAICHKRGRKWWVEFRGLGCPSPFKTRREAEAWASNWTLMLDQDQRGLLS